MIASVVSKIEKLQVDLAIENPLMDKLAIKTEKVKVIFTHLSHVNAQVDELKFEKDVMKRVVADVNQNLQTLVETRDSCS